MSENDGYTPSKLNINVTLGKLMDRLISIEKRIPLLVSAYRKYDTIAKSLPIDTEERHIAIHTSIYLMIRIGHLRQTHQDTLPQLYELLKQKRLEERAR